MTKAPWGSYLGAAKARYDEIKQGEGFKLDLAEALTRAREALLRDEPDWPTLVKAAIAHPQNKIINWRNHSKLTEWIDGNVGEALDALSGMWSEDDRTPGDRIRAFDGGLPESVFSRGAAGTRLNVASYLLMGVAPQRYPPYRRKPFRAAYERLGYPQSSAADSGGEYEYALDFLDRVLEEARRRGMNWPDTRLEAQSVVWWNPEDAGSSPSRSAPRQLGHALNTILYGPPGTGKTWHTVTRGVAIVENRAMAELAQEDRVAVKRRFDEHRRAGRIEMVTFHQNTTYQDFVEGIRPVLAERPATPATDTGSSAQHAQHGNGADIGYELSRGVFRRIAERAVLDANGRYVLVIDEINRGNIAAIFGELITLIEDSKRIGSDDETRVTLPGSKTEFGVPANLHVVGTMNTADRSIALLDTALRRRFVFEEMMPDAAHPGISTDVDGVNCRELLGAMNRRITVLLDREHQIGHAYFLGIDTLAALASMFRTRILPLLQEYFYDDWAKIRAVLNANGFVQESAPPEELVRAELADAGRAVFDCRGPDDGRWTTATAYQAIYEPKASREDGSVDPDA